MSSPAPVPSKAAIHALRGLLFGTSCSIVLLAEERRRRISIARAAVENGRKLKSAKCYSTAGTAALEALQADVAADPGFSSWSLSVRGNSFLNGTEKYRSDHWLADGLDTNDLGPDPRQPRQSAKRYDTTRTSQRLDAHSGPTEAQGLNHANPSEKFEAKRSGRPRPSPTEIAHFAKPIISPSHSISLHTPPDKPLHSLKSVLDIFFASREDGGSLESTLNALRGEHDGELFHPSPRAALRFVQRAAGLVPQGQPLPSWLLQFSHSLSNACLLEGDYTTAAWILDILVQHGPVDQETFLAYRPFNMIRLLLADKKKGNSRQQLDLAGRILVAEIIDDQHCRAGQFELARDIITRLILGGYQSAAAELFERAKSECKPDSWATFWFIDILQDHGHHTEAIDVFTTLRGLDSAPAHSLQSACERILDSAVHSRGYEALEVFRVVRHLQQSHAIGLPPSWFTDIIWCYWRSSKNYPGTEALYEELESHEFYGLEDKYSVRSLGVEVPLQAGDWATAHSRFEELCASFPQAKSDVALVCGFAKFHAMHKKWAKVRAIFKRMKGLGPLAAKEQDELNAAFSKVASEFSKHHTWAETEKFVTSSIEEFGFALDSRLVISIADRHGRCRETKALGRWFRFCQEAGFAMDASFWESILTRCKFGWRYSNVQIVALYRDLKPLGIDESFVQAREFVVRLAPAATKDLRSLLVRTASAQKPSDEASVFEHMKMDAHKGRWKCVLGSYKRATHKGMGFSSRCLRLAVQASIRSEDGSKTWAVNLIRKEQLQGHDVSKAIVPLVLASLEDIRADERQATEEAGRTRGRPYRHIQNTLRKLRDDKIRIDDAVFHKAAQVCLDLRNYREAASICVFATEYSGSKDVCSTVNNFSTLCRVFTARHEYDRLGWLLEQLEDREYRTSKHCRVTLKWAAHYLKRASEADKAEEFKASDLASLKQVEDVLQKVSDENAAWRAQGQELLFGSNPAMRVPMINKHRKLSMDSEDDGYHSAGSGSDSHTLSTSPPGQPLHLSRLGPSELGHPARPSTTAGELQLGLDSDDEGTLSADSGVGIRNIPKTTSLPQRGPAASKLHTGVEMEAVFKELKASYGYSQEWMRSDGRTEAWGHDREKGSSSAPCH